MKKGLFTFVLMILIIALLSVTACYGIPSIKLDSAFGKDAIRKGLDLVGGSSILLQADEEDGEVSEETLDAIVAVLNTRVSNAGYTEATVTKISAKKQIRVEIPAVKNPQDAVDLVGKTAKLTFVDSDGNTVVEGSQVKKAVAAVQQDQTYGVNKNVVELEFDSSTMESFADATERMAAKPEGENYIAIMLDDEVISSPRVQERLYTTNCVITGDFTADAAEMLANLISSGNLPCEVKLVQTQTVSATLGADAFSKAMLAGLIGIILVMLFMIIMYQLPGLVSAIALVGYIAITALCIVGFKINLSLPGIAGIFLTIGMAVDANVVIFERIREELNAGKSVKAAVRSGFDRAFSAIIDSNITTLIAAVVLWIFGTGPIQGFAITLFIGVIISLISALLFTKVMLNAIANMGVSNNRLFGAKRIAAKNN